MGTPLLQILLTCCYRSAAALTGAGSAGRHRPDHIEQVTQRVQPLSWRTSAVYGYLPANTQLKCVIAPGHLRILSSLRQACHNCIIKVRMWRMHSRRALRA